MITENHDQLEFADEIEDGNIISGSGGTYAF